MNQAVGKVFKAGAPEGGNSVYLSQREYVNVDGHIDNVRGLAHIPDCKDKLRGQTVYASLVCIFRHGRKEDETCGLKFSKELMLDRVQVYPSTAEGNQDKGKQTPMQAKLIQKIGPGDAKPFTLNFPKNSPNSTHITGKTGDEADMGVHYEVRLWIAVNPEDVKHDKKSTASMTVRKTQWAPVEALRSPVARGEKEWTLTQGKCVMDVALAKETFYHGEEIPVNITVSNSSGKGVSKIKASVIQNCDLMMANAKYDCKITDMTTTDGCPCTDGTLRTIINLKPLAQLCHNKQGLAIDHALTANADECNLASTSFADSGNPNDLLGVVVSYTVKITCYFAGVGNGELSMLVPIKLVHPRPDSAEAKKNTDIKVKAAKEGNFDQQPKRFIAQDSISVENVTNL